MSRPIKTTADWFKFERGFLTTHKMNALRHHYGNRGAFTLIYIWEYLLGCEDQCTAYNEDTLDIWAIDLNEDIQFIKDVVNCCIKYKLLQIDVARNLYSEDLNEKLSGLKEKRERDRERQRMISRGEKGNSRSENNSSRDENNSTRSDNNGSRGEKGGFRYIREEKNREREENNSSTAPARVRGGGNSSGGAEDSSQPDISSYIQRIVGDTDALFKIVRETKYSKEDVIRWIYQLGRKWELRKPHEDYGDFLRHIIDTLNIKFKKKERPEQIHVENFSTAKTLWTVVQADLILTDSVHVLIYESLEVYDYKEKEKELILIAPTGEIRDAVKNDLMDSIKDCMRKYTPSQFDVKCGTDSESK